MNATNFRIVVARRSVFIPSRAHDAPLAPHSGAMPSDGEALVTALLNGDHDGATELANKVNANELMSALQEDTKRTALHLAAMQKKDDLIVIMCKKQKALVDKEAEARAIMHLEPNPTRTRR